MFRRPLSIGAASVLAVAAATIAPLSARAATQCAVDASPDAKVVLDSPHPTFDVALNSSPNGCYDTVVYNVLLGGAKKGSVTFNGDDSEPFELASNDGPGKYTLAFASGTDSKGNTITSGDVTGSADARDAITVDLAGMPRVSGTIVRGTAHVEEYNAKYDDFYPIARGTTVTFQAKTPYGWQTLATAKVGRRGDATVTKVDSKSKKDLAWRAVVKANGTHWDGDSIDNASGAND